MSGALFGFGRFDRLLEFFLEIRVWDRAITHILSDFVTPTGTGGGVNIWNMRRHTKWNVKPHVLVERTEIHSEVN